MNYQEQIQHNNMETSFEPFSMRQYVLLSCEKNMFQNWPFAEKYLRLCLKYGVTNVLPPLESRGSSMDISYDKKARNAGDYYDREASFAATISTVCERIQLMSLSYDDSNQEKEIPSDKYRTDIKNTNVEPVNWPSKTLARKRERSRRWKRKFKSMTEIYATARHRTLEEDGELNELSCTSEVIRVAEEQMQIGSEYYGDFDSELTNDGDNHDNGLAKRSRVLKSWRKSSSSSHKAFRSYQGTRS